ncbi:MAG TPA: tRNA adenosine(34) deaminase TadA, partial [Pseudoduganella sp.]
HHTAAVGGVLVEDCGNLLKAFFASRRAASRAARAGRSTGQGREQV